MRWIKQNIGGFGGNPNLITASGESAGGCKLSMRLVLSKSNELSVRNDVSRVKRAAHEPVSEYRRRRPALQANPTSGGRSIVSNNRQSIRTSGKVPRGAYRSIAQPPSR